MEKRNCYDCGLVGICSLAHSIAKEMIDHKAWFLMDTYEHCKLAVGATIGKRCISFHPDEVQPVLYNDKGENLGNYPASTCIEHCLENPGFSWEYGDSRFTVKEKE